MGGSPHDPLTDFRKIAGEEPAAEQTETHECGISCQPGERADGLTKEAQKAEGEQAEAEEKTAETQDCKPRIHEGPMGKASR